MQAMRIIITGRQINCRHAHSRSQEGNIAKGTGLGFEAMFIDVFFKIGIVTTVKDRIITAFAVNFYQHFQLIQSGR